MQSEVYAKAYLPEIVSSNEVASKNSNHEGHEGHEEKEIVTKVERKNCNNREKRNFIELSH